MAAALAQLPAKTSCLLGPTTTAEFLARALALLSGHAPSGRAPTCHQESPGLHRHPLTPHPGPFDRARGTCCLCHRHLRRLQGPSPGSWSLAESVQPAGSRLGISLGAAAFGTHYLIINFLLCRPLPPRLSSAPPPQIRSPRGALQ